MVQNFCASGIQPKDIDFNLNTARGLVKRFAKSRKQLHAVFEQGDGIASFEAQMRMNQGHCLTLLLG